MNAVSTPDERIVAVLHDVVEDCPGWSFERLREEGFSNAVLRGLDAVTCRPDEKNQYETLIARSGADPIGRVVKMADLRDNMDLGRISEPTDRDIRRIEKYRKALRVLELAAYAAPEQPSRQLDFPKSGGR